MSLPFSTLWLQFLDKIIGDDDNEDDDERREDDEDEDEGDEEADVQLALALSLSEAGRNVGESNQQFSEQQVRGGSYEDQEELDNENQEFLLLALSMLETEDVHNEVYVDQQSSQPITPPQPDELERPQVISRCVICLDRQSEITFVPCGHLCSCIQCSEHLGNSRCPLCRTNIESKLRIIHP